MTRASSFSKAQFHCPSCSSFIEKHADSCQKCGFNLTHACQKFPFTPPILEPILDQNHKLDEHHKQLLHKKLLKFSTKFPNTQLFFCLLDLPPQTPIREFTFWLHNQAPLNTEHQNQSFSLLLYDTKKNRVAISFDYQLERYINASLIEPLLAQFTTKSAHSNSPYESCSQFISDFSQLLISQWKKIRNNNT